jgi:hypothetical protein
MGLPITGLELDCALLTINISSIGNRKVGKGPNFCSLQREIALGKLLAQEVERWSKLLDDPVVTLGKTSAAWGRRR